MAAGGAEFSDSGSVASDDSWGEAAVAAGAADHRDTVGHADALEEMLPRFQMFALLWRWRSWCRRNAEARSMQEANAHASHVVRQIRSGVIEFPPSGHLTHDDWKNIATYLNEKMTAAHDRMFAALSRPISQDPEITIGAMGAVDFSKISAMNHDNLRGLLPEIPFWSLKDTFKHLRRVLSRDYTRALQENERKLCTKGGKKGGASGAPSGTADRIRDATNLELLLDATRLPPSDIRLSPKKLEELTIRNLTEKLRRTPGQLELLVASYVALLRKLKPGHDLVFRTFVMGHRLLELIRHETSARYSVIRRALEAYEAERDAARNPMAVKVSPEMLNIIHPALEGFVSGALEDFRRIHRLDEVTIGRLILEHPRALLEPAMPWARFNNDALFPSQRELVEKLEARGYQGLFCHDGATGSGKTTLVSLLVQKLQASEYQTVVVTPCAGTAAQILGPLKWTHPDIIPYVVAQASNVTASGVSMTHLMEATQLMRRARIGKRRCGAGKLDDADMSKVLVAKDAVEDEDEDAEAASGAGGGPPRRRTRKLKYRVWTVAEKLQARAFFCHDLRSLLLLWQQFTPEQRSKIILFVDDPGAATHDELTALGQVLVQPPRGVVLLSATLPDYRGEAMTTFYSRVFPALAEAGRPLEVVEHKDAATGTMICDLTGRQAAIHDTCRTKDDVRRVIGLISRESSLGRLPNPRQVLELAQRMGRSDLAEVAMAEARTGPVLQIFWTRAYLGLLQRLVDDPEWTDGRIGALFAEPMTHGLRLPAVDGDPDVAEIIRRGLLEKSIIATGDPFALARSLLGRFVPPVPDDPTADPVEHFVRRVRNFEALLDTWAKARRKRELELTKSRASSRREGTAEGGRSDAEIAEALERDFPMPVNPLMHILQRGVRPLEVEPSSPIWDGFFELGILAYIGIGCIWRGMPPGIYSLLSRLLREGRLRYLIADNSVAFGINIECTAVIMMRDFDEPLAVMIQMAGRPGRLGKGESASGEVYGSRIAEAIRAIPEGRLFEDQAEALAGSIDRARVVFAPPS